MVTWEREVDKWALIPVNKDAINEGRKLIKTLHKGDFLGIQCTFWFEKSRVLCKDGSSKKLDLDNRCKAILDKVSKLIQVDDSRFWKVVLFKMVCDADTLEGCDVEMNQIWPVGE